MQTRIWHRFPVSDFTANGATAVSWNDGNQIRLGVGKVLDPKDGGLQHRHQRSHRTFIDSYADSFNR